MRGSSLKRAWARIRAADSSNLALAAGAGFLAALGRPGIELPGATVVGWTLFCAALVRSSSLATALGLGIAYGAVLLPLVTIGSVTWGAGVPVVLTGIGYALCPLPLSLWAHWAARRLSPLRLWVATVAAWALCMELGEAVGYAARPLTPVLATSFPWLLGGARWVGSSVLCGVGMASCLVAGERFVRRDDLGRWARFGAAVVPLAAGGALLLGLAALSRLTAPAASASVRVGVPQINADSTYYLSRMNAPGVVAELERRLDSQLARLERDVDLLALTETFDGRFPLLLPGALSRWRQLARARGQGVLLTSYLVEASGRKSNAVAGIDPGGSVVGVHTKVDLAPVGEEELTGGADYRVLPVLPGVTVGALICQESYMAAGSRTMAARGANLLVATTSDVTFKSSVLVFEHLATTQLRAVETGRDIVWSSNAGPSGLITRWGSFSGGAFRRPEAVRLTAEVHAGRTPFLVVHRFVPLLCALLLAAAFVRRRPPADVPAPLASCRAWPVVAVELALAPVLWLGSPALVELRRGEPARALDAPYELFRKSSPLIEPASIERFAGTGDGLDGAIAHWLTYYGLDVTAATLPRPLPAPDFTAIAEYLRRYFGVATRLLPAAPEPPRVESLVRLEDGSFAVVEYPGGEVAQLFLPRERAGVLVPLSVLAPLLGPDALVPRLAE